jgi:peptidoglycan/xylan/chitin deacetylase (PgdA/CDA1 family)
MNYNIRQTLFESFDTLGDWTATNGTIQMSGGKLELTSTSGGNCYATKTINTNFGTKANFKLTVYIPDTATLNNISALEVFMSSTTNFSKYFNFLNGVSNLHVGHNEIIISRAAWTNTGAEDWSNTMVRLRVRVNALTDVTAVLRFDEMYSDYYARPKAIIDFDDSRLTVYTVAYPYMRKYGFKGSVYVNSGFVDVFPGNYMTTAMLHELYDAGWDMGNHTDTHPHMDESTDAQNQSQLDLCDAYLRREGFTRENCHKHFVFPYGDYDDDSLGVVKSRGYITARTTQSNRTQANSLDNAHLLLCQSFANDASTATLISYIDRTIRDGGVLRLLFHSLVDSPAESYEYTSADFRTVIDYLAKKQNEIDVVTLTEWYRGLSNSRRLI